MIKNSSLAMLPARITFSGGPELSFPINGQSSSLFLKWLSENQAVNSKIKIAFGKEMIKIRAGSGNLVDLENAKNFINKNSQGLGGDHN